MSSAPRSFLSITAIHSTEMLVAQAQTERLTLVTADSAIERYDVRIMRARS